MDSDQESAIDFGIINFNEVVEGENGLSYHQNMGLNFWGLALNDVEYGKEPMISLDSILAVIDTGNFTIQLPPKVFDTLFKEMKDDDDSLYINKDGILASRTKECHQLEDDMKSLRFITGEDTWFEIKPEGYMYSMNSFGI